MKLVGLTVPTSLLVPYRKSPRCRDQHVQGKQLPISLPSPGQHASSCSWLRLLTLLLSCSTSDNILVDSYIADADVFSMLLQCLGLPYLFPFLKQGSWQTPAIQDILITKTVRLFYSSVSGCVGLQKSSEMGPFPFSYSRVFRVGLTVSTCTPSLFLLYIVSCSCVQPREGPSTATAPPQTYSINCCL